MKLNWETEADKWDRLGQWHKHFVFWPRAIGTGDWRFLETVERRATFMELGHHRLFYKWEYREA